MVHARRGAVRDTKRRGFSLLEENEAVFRTINLLQPGDTSPILLLLNFLILSFVTRVPLWKNAVSLPFSARSVSLATIYCMS